MARWLSSTVILSVLLLGDRLGAQPTALETLLVSSDLVVHAKVLNIRLTREIKNDKADYIIQCQTIRPYRSSVKLMSGTTFELYHQQMQDIVADDGSSVKEKMALDKNRQYILFLEFEGAKSRKDTQPILTFTLSDRWVGIQEYSPYLDRLLKKRLQERKNHLHEAQTEFSQLSAILERIESGQIRRLADLSPADQKRLLTELKRKDDVHFAHDFRRISALALGNIKALRAAPILIALMTDKDEELSVRYEAVRALGKIGHSMALGPLLDAVADDAIGTYASKAIVQISSAGADLGSLKTLERFRQYLSVLRRKKVPDKSRQFEPFQSPADTTARIAGEAIEAVCSVINMFSPTNLEHADRAAAEEIANRLLKGLFSPAAHPNVFKFCRIYGRSSKRNK